MDESDCYKPTRFILYLWKIKQKITRIKEVKRDIKRSVHIWKWRNNTVDNRFGIIQGELVIDVWSK